MAGWSGMDVIIRQPGWSGMDVIVRSAGWSGVDVVIREPGWSGQDVIIRQPGWSGTDVVVRGCFPMSELVNICPDAYIPIASLKIGDKISSWDEERKKLQYTAITKIHKYKVFEIMCFNNILQVSSTHPLMVAERDETGIIIVKWKVAFDIKVGDCVVGAGGKLIPVKTRSRHWYNAGIEVLNLSTDSGVPFIVRNCVVRAENAQGGIKWADTPVTKRLAA